MARQRLTRIPTPHIDRIVMRDVQYQFEVNRFKAILGGRGWSMWVRAPQVEIDRIVIRDAILGGRGLCGRGRPRFGNSPYIVEIDRIVIKDVQYQFEVNRCRNEEVIVKGNFELAWSMLAGRSRIDRIVIRVVQYQFEVNWCRNEEVNMQLLTKFGSSADSVGGDSGQDGRWK
ncbi:hypothetical protein DPMN_073335 [Dreissena polymorpha]|uniref:Uncharacterized protein n=1 Tax=Dreissena polymorpha TaxID=45954 RepID=A0A9D4BYX3_DREPO|nr:hypothetical protein DPMN_073335 [Dreissena polymorpha]